MARVRVNGESCMAHLDNGVEINTITPKFHLNSFPRSQTTFRPSWQMGHLCRSGKHIYLTFRLCDYMGSRGWSPGL